MFGLGFKQLQIAYYLQKTRHLQREYPLLSKLLSSRL